MIKNGTIRVVEDKSNLIYIQERFLWFFWKTILKTYSPKGALAFLEFTGKDYNMVTGYYE